MSIRRIFENENWVVVEKPSGWLTTPARSKDDPRPCLGLVLQAEIGRQIYPVHRLDFEVGGLVLFALNAACHRTASGWFEHGAVVKTYSALTVPGPGEPPREWQEWRSQMLRGKKRSYVSPHGKECVTEARVVGVGGEPPEGAGGGDRTGDIPGALGRASGIQYWQWELRPLTGRPHQLRVELANHGSPILGDVLYGGPEGEENAIALTSVGIDLSRVIGNERAGLPEALRL